MQAWLQPIRFVAIGALATGAHLLCLTALVEILAWPPVPASCVGALVGAGVSYLLNYRYTFASTRPHALPRLQRAVLISAHSGE